MIATACSSILGETPTDSAPSSPGGESGTSTTAPDANCVRFTGDHSAHIDTGTLAGDALFLSGEIFICAADAVVGDPSDLNQLSAAAQLAAALQAPLLLPEPRLAAELGRLKPDRVHLVGAVNVDVPGDAEIIRHDISGALTLASETLGVDTEIAIPATPDASTVVETALAIDSGTRIAVPTQPAAQGSTTTTAAPPDIDERAIVSGLAVPNDSASLWMIDASEPDTVILASGFAPSIGASVVAVDGEDVLGYPALADAMEGHSPETIRYVGGVPEAGEWELAVLTGGRQVPGGGFHILPEDSKRRFVAFYGHPNTDALGVLGEQGPAETRSRMQEFVEAYGGDGAQVIPTFEIIASVASAGATDDGDYSYEWPPETFQPWVDYAAENGMYVVLDLQSGREDFRSQAMIYEELLKEPHVGIAFDPEWRLTDTQVHLQQVGTVDAAELNQAINYVADLVRDNGLPQKLILLHQFRTHMITNRDQLVDRPEIQLVVQMDGDGTEPQKDATWDVLKRGAENAHWAWGWKNFFDEDEPGPPSPESTMGKNPSPVFVSYQ